MAEGRPFMLHPLQIGKQTKVTAEALRNLPSGLHGTEVADLDDWLTGGLVRSITTYVYTSKAGKPVTKQVRALLPIRPRWLPRFLWRRIPTREACWALEVEPVWAYPDADLPVPANLGAPVPIYRNQMLDYAGDDPNWRRTDRPDDRHRWD